jgi:hypothetical protein
VTIETVNERKNQMTMGDDQRKTLQMTRPGEIPTDNTRGEIKMTTPEENPTDNTRGDPN